MVCESCGAQLPIDELIKLHQVEEEVLSWLPAQRPELILYNECCVCMHVMCFCKSLYECLSACLCDFDPAAFSCKMDVTECFKWTGRECVGMGSKTAVMLCKAASCVKWLYSLIQGM